jgi:ElaB/YqjD/DUF883 family membrane-anchored ribosome-binding protein
MTQHPSTGEPEIDGNDALRSDLEQTRERVSSDIEALGTKLSPQNLKAEAKRAVTRTVERGTDRIREEVGAAQTSILGFWRENPIPLSLIGVGLGLLAYNSRKTKAERGRGPDHAVVGRSLVYDERGDARADVPGKLERLKDGVEDRVHRVKEAAGATAHQAWDKVEDQPLVLGAVALGAGVAVGLLIPATESENKLVGEYRERFVSDAKRRVGELGGVAKHAAEAAQDAVKSELDLGSAPHAAE